MKFWNNVSRIILSNRIIILCTIALMTAGLATQIKNIRFSYTEANLLPSNHEENIKYDQFLDLFGEEANLILLATDDQKLFEPETFTRFKNLCDKISALDGIDGVLSITDLKVLERNTQAKKFELKPVNQFDFTTKEGLNNYKDYLFKNLPFYNNLLFNKENGTIQFAIYINKEIVNTIKRKKLILNKIVPILEGFEASADLDLHASGMPYVRTLNSANIKAEMGLFVGLALGVTAFIFFLFFKSFRATAITMLVVSIGVIWAFGLIGLLGFEITILTALIPPLIIVIGVPNAIFLINKYQQEIKKHGNKIKSLQRVINKVGNATLMTNMTTSAGFATFIFTQSQLLNEFGIIASINIMAIFVLSLLIIPSLYSFMPVPEKKHLKHLEKKWIHKLVEKMVLIVRNRKTTTYTVTIVVLILSMIGLYQIKVSGSLIEDMPKTKNFYQDIRFFESRFGGIMPLEILIDTKRKKGAYQIKNLKKVEKLSEAIDLIPSLSSTISINNLIKYSKQAFYKGKAKYFQLPNNNEKAFILSYLKNSENDGDFLKNLISEDGRYIRLTTYMKDIGASKMERIEAQLQSVIDKEFPAERFDVTLTGKALIFIKGTDYLINNLVISLSLAILLISVFMGWMFRSTQMIFISLIPNLLPLLVTGGLMGYLGIPIKPSTILVFSIAFGISVDDTIHFLAKYRQELIASNWKIRRSIYRALRETGVSMFYTSIVLFFGFMVFIISSFGGTKALGGLVSVTLLFAMVSNLILLPSLLLSLERKIANKKTFKKPKMNILEEYDNKKGG